MSIIQEAERDLLNVIETAIIEYQVPHNESWSNGDEDFHYVFDFGKFEVRARSRNYKYLSITFMGFLGKSHKFQTIQLMSGPVKDYTKGVNNDHAIAKDTAVARKIMALTEAVKATLAGMEKKRFADE